jgi:hypothetical protein
MAARVKSTDESADSISERGVDAAKAEPQVTQDDIYTKLLKYIPAPLLALYLFVVNIILGATDGSTEKWLSWITLALFLALVAIFLVRRQVRRVLQIVASIFAFGAIAAASPGPFQLIDDWKEWFGSVALGIVLAILIALKPGDLPDSVINDTTN